jgi:hypothetical protein
MHGRRRETASSDMAVDIACARGDTRPFLRMHEEPDRHRARRMTAVHA